MAAIRRTLFAAAAVISLASASQAATLSTPFFSAQGGQLLACFVSNLNKRPVMVTVTFSDFDGSAEATQFDTCNGSPLAPGASCQVELPRSTAGRCVVVAKTGKIQAGIDMFSLNNSLVIVVPATK